MICGYCKKEYDGRSNSRYCSSACKQRAYRQNTGLSDSVQALQPQQFVYKPIHQVPNVRAVNQFNNAMVGSLTNGVGSNLSDNLNKITNINNHPFNTLSMILGGAVGAFFAFAMTDKKGNRFVNIISGVGIGLFAGQLGYTFYNQLKEYNRQKTEFNLQNQTIQQTTTLSDFKVLSSNEVQYMQVPSIKFNGVWGDFLGQNINYDFLMFVYGAAGGGKSHFVTDFSKYIEQMGKVLYVLAEEGITNSVQNRIGKYNLVNTNFLVTRNTNDVLAELNNSNMDYKFVILDSLNGLANYNNHLEFVRRLKDKNLYGIVIVQQVNKDGQFIGKNDLLHEVDIEISVEDGIAETRKNRFSNESKQLSIFSSNDSNIMKFQKVDGLGL
jgi:hypothetical protein